jgi:hypothetical protein
MIRTACVILLFGCQVWGQVRGAAAAPRPGPVVRPGVPRAVGHYRPWWGPGWFGWPETPSGISHSPVTPEKEAPRYVVNKDYVREKLSPQTTLFPEGLLPVPVATPIPPAPIPNCTVKMKDGQVIEAQSCWVRDDMLGFTHNDRVVRVSLDLVASH